MRELNIKKNESGLIGDFVLIVLICFCIVVSCMLVLPILFAYSPYVKLFLFIFGMGLLSGVLIGLGQLTD